MRTTPLTFESLRLLFRQDCHYFTLGGSVSQSSSHLLPLTMAPSCCPSGALGAAPLCDRQPRGETIFWDPSPSSSSSSSSSPPLSKMTVYKVGSVDSSTSNKKHRVVVVFTDVYGLESGNHKAFCDTIQEELNKSFPTTVYCPDLFYGHPLMRQWGLPDGINLFLGGLWSILWGLKGRCSAVKIDKMLTEIIEPNVKATGCNLPVGVVGFCFGGWVVARALALNSTNSIFGFGVGIHPGLNVESLVRGGTSEMDLAERTRNKPILFLPAKQDVLVKPTSDIVKYMARRRATSPDKISVAFESMPHGFVARGDYLGSEYKEAQEKAIELTVGFLHDHSKM